MSRPQTTDLLEKKRLGLTVGLALSRSGQSSEHKSEGFLKSLWNNITHPHHDAEQSGDGAAKPGSDSKDSKKEDDKKNKP